MRAAGGSCAYLSLSRRPGAVGGEPTQQGGRRGLRRAGGTGGWGAVVGCARSAQGIRRAGESGVLGRAPLTCDSGWRSTALDAPRQLPGSAVGLARATPSGAGRCCSGRDIGRSPSLSQAAIPPGPGSRTMAARTSGASISSSRRISSSTASASSMPSFSRMAQRREARRALTRLAARVPCATSSAGPSGSSRTRTAW